MHSEEVSSDVSRKTGSVETDRGRLNKGLVMIECSIAQQCKERYTQQAILSCEKAEKCEKNGMDHEAKNDKIDKIDKIRC